MLKFEGVKKHYEDFELDLTLEVPEGYVTGLIGAMCRKVQRLKQH